MTDKRQASLMNTGERIELFEKQQLGPVWFVVLFLFSAAVLLYTVRGFVEDLVLAMILVGVFRTTYERIFRWIGGRWVGGRRAGDRWLAAALVTLLILVCVLAPVVFLLMALGQQAAAALGTLQEYVNNDATSRLTHALEEGRQALAAQGLEFSDTEVRDFLRQVADGAADWAVSSSNTVLNNAASAALHFAVLLVMVFYFFVDADRLRDFIMRLSPLPNEEEELLITKFKAVARGTLLGNGAGSLLQGVLGGLAMWAVGLPSPVLWGVVMAVFAFLPLVGVSIVVIPATAYLALTGEYGKAVGFFAFCMVQAIVVENILKTKWIGAGARMHDLLVFLVIIGGIGTFGIFGIIYGPLIAVAFLTFAELYLQSYRRRLATEFLRRTGSEAPPPTTAP